MKKLFYAEKLISVMFVSNKDTNLTSEAYKFLREEMDNGYKPNPYISIKEINKLNDIPKEWIDAIVWGQDQSDLTTYQYFKKILEKDSEYKEYLRLKNKFEGTK